MRVVLVGLTLLLASCSRYPEECELMIREAAKWGVLEISAPDRVAGTTYTWNSGSIVLTNGYGAHVSAEATCRGGMPLTLITPTGTSECVAVGDYVSCNPADTD